MKAILEFNLPEEREEFELASNAAQYSIVLDDLDEFLRRKLKYESETYSEEQLGIYEEVRKHLWDLRNEREI